MTSFSLILSLSKHSNLHKITTKQWLSTAVYKHLTDDVKCTLHSARTHKQIHVHMMSLGEFAYSIDRHSKQNLSHFWSDFVFYIYSETSSAHGRLRTKSRNWKIPKCKIPNWTKSWMDKIQNGQDSELDKIQNGQNAEMDKIQNINFYCFQFALFFVKKKIWYECLQNQILNVVCRN